MEKICFITPQFKTGGGNRVFIEIANELASNNIIEIIYPNNSKDKNTFNINNGIKIIPIGKLYKGKIMKLFNMIFTLFWIRKNRKEYKLIITDPIMSLFYFLLPLENLYRFIQADDYRIFDDGAIIRNKFLLKIYKNLTLYSYKSKKIKYIFNSRYVYENYIKDSKNYDVKCQIVHPAINKEIFKNYNIRKYNEINICLVARKHPLKGFVTFIEAWKKFNYKEKINKIYIISHDNLEKFDLNDKKYEIIVPKNDYEIANIMNKAHIFISTSWWEGFGLPPLEAMACGNNIITSKSGGVNEYAKDMENCLMFSPKNVEELIKKMELYLFSNNLNKEIESNRKKTINKFSWNISAKQLLKIIKE